MSEAGSSGTWIEVPSFDGRRFGAYLALPPRTPRGDPAPGIVVLQEIWGVNAHIRAVADQYASDGYVAIAPDLFWRMDPRVDLDYDDDGTAKAYAYRKRIDLDLADKDIASTAEVLKAMSQVAGGVGVVGYCMGGMLAYRAAARAGIDCAVCYYGGGIAQQLDLAPSIAVPMAMHFGGKDPHITPDQVEAITAVLGDRPDVRIDTYPASDHGFNCWGRRSYDQGSAALARGRTLAFFATHLGRRP